MESEFISQITNSGCLKQPIRFFPYLLLTPAFPPIDESTCANKVVGMLINLTPRCIIPATKPDRSPITPPPSPIIRSPRSNFFDKSLSIIFSATINSLFFSPGDRIISIILMS